MRITHVKPETHVESQGCRVGDVIVSLDGETFAEPYPSVILWEKLKTQAEVTLTIRRGEETVEVDLISAQVQRGDLGARGLLEVRSDD